MDDCKQGLRIMPHMRAIKELPNQYHVSWILDLSRSKRMIVGLNLISLPLLLFFGWLFYKLISRIRPGIDLFGFLSSQAIWLIIALLGTYSVIVILHEICHGVFFYFFTMAAPKFSFRWVYAYAAAPDFFIGRNTYMVVALAPLGLISMIGLTLASLLPLNLVGLIWFGLATNAAGSVSDLYIAGRLFFKHPTEALVQDEGDRFSVYNPNNKLEI